MNNTLMNFEQALSHQTALFNYAMKFTHNANDAKDLVQETYIKAIRFWDKFEQGTNCKAWLFQIMKNSYINEYRKKIKEPQKVDYEDVQNFCDSMCIDKNKNNEEMNLFRNLLDDKMINAIDKLPKDYRTIIILCDIEGLTYEETASFFNCPIGTVRSRLHRGRNLLKQFYNE